MAPASVQPKIYTVHDIYHLPEGQRAELIDGHIYNMVPPNRIHQKLINRLSQTITNHIDRKQGDCEVYPAPLRCILKQRQQKLCRTGYFSYLRQKDNG